MESLQSTQKEAEPADVSRGSLEPNANSLVRVLTVIPISMLTITLTLTLTLTFSLTIDGGEICYGHGACYAAGECAGHCLCDTGYGGTDGNGYTACNDCIVATDSTTPSYFGNTLEVHPATLNCQLCPGGGTCSGHGTCSGGKTGSGSCSCESGWSLDSDGSCSVAQCAACKVSELREEFATADAYGCTFKCSACPKGGICFGTTNVDPLEGYWTANDASNNVYKCLILGNCEGGTASTCDAGHNGPICATCIEGWALAAGVCVECAGRTGSPTLWALIVVVILVISCCIVRCFICGDPEENSTQKATSSTMPFTSNRLPNQ